VQQALEPALCSFVAEESWRTTASNVWWLYSAIDSTHPSLERVSAAVLHFLDELKSSGD
jgi:hypothetical protein